MVNNLSLKIHINKAIKTDLDLQNWCDHFGFEEKSVLLCIILCQELVMMVESLPGESILTWTTHRHTQLCVSSCRLTLLHFFQNHLGEREHLFSVHFLFGAYLLVLKWQFLNSYHEPAKVCACVSECSSFPFPLEQCFLADFGMCGLCLSVNEVDKACVPSQFCILHKTWRWVFSAIRDEVHLLFRRLRPL